MRKSRRNFIFWGVFFASLACCFMAAQSLFAQQCRVVRVQSSARGDMHLEPNVMWVEKETCVVWNNWSRFSDIKVNFPNGKACQKATSAAVGFELEDIDENVCLITNWIPLGGTSSLTFKEEGEYPYIIKAGEGKELKGKIIVR